MICPLSCYDANHNSPFLLFFQVLKRLSIAAQPKKFDQLGQATDR